MESSIYYLRMFLFLSAAALAFVLSFLAKLLIDAVLLSRIAIIGSLEGLQRTENAGIAFGMQLLPGLQELLILCALTVVIILAWKAARASVRHRERTRVLMIGYGCIVGGALCNIVDRSLDRYVTDFIQVGTFPVFNVADSFITIGVLFLLAESLAMNRNM